MANDINISAGRVRRGEPFQVKTERFSIAETTSGYTIYKSVSCPSVKAGKAAWAELPYGAEAPSGWKKVEDAIPADTQAEVHDVIPSDFFFLKGLADDEALINNIINPRAL